LKQFFLKGEGSLGRLILSVTLASVVKETNLGCRTGAFLRLRVSNRLPSLVFITDF
jgi:hypothetical protein